MTRIDGVQQIVAMLQTAMANRLEPGRRNLGAARKERKGAPTNRQSESALTERLQTQLAAIDRSDPDCNQKMLRIFLESVLAAHFGEALLLDPAFSNLVDDVQQQMENNAGLAPLIAEAMASLLEGR